MGAQTFLYKNTNHVAHLNNMRLSGKLCDVTIRVNDKKFQAHKIILAANLNYFESMFLNDFQESKQDVTMQGVEEKDLEAFITYAYTGEILLTDTNALNLLEVANYFTEDGIKESSIKFLKENLRKEEAYRAYKLANAIECTSLKSVAKKTILSNLRDGSLTSEYLSLDFDSLKEILSSANLDFVQSQQILFEEIVRWILHDVTNRRSHITDLLHLIDITKLSSDYLWKYFSTRIDNQEYYSYIVKDIMSLYNSKSQQIHQAENLRQKLVIVGVINKKLHVQFYNFTEKKWSKSREIRDSKTGWYSKPIILCDTCYYFSSDDYREYSRASLQVFNVATARSASLRSNGYSFLCNSAICTCAEMLYLCGGEAFGNFCSNQVLRYDPRTSSFKAVSQMNVGRVYAAAIFYQGYLYVMGGCTNYGFTDSVEKYDPVTKEWTDLPSMHEVRYSFEVTALDGKLYACGGPSCPKSVEVYDPAKNSWQLVASMNQGRSKFLLVAREGKLLAIGGNDENTVEVYDPSKDQWQMDNEMSSELQIEYPGGGLISSTDS